MTARQRRADAWRSQRRNRATSTTSARSTAISEIFR